MPLSVACEEAVAKTWRLTLSSSHGICVPFVRLKSAARLDNWEGLAGHVLRSQLKRPYPTQSASAYIPANALRVVRPGDILPSGEPLWTVLRIGHVNMKMRNAPAPAEATGWECDKLDPRGIDANFAAYIGRMADGPAKGKLAGMIVDSWECGRQTWTWQMEEWFRSANGYDVKTILPAVFGWVVDSPDETKRMLLDWRKTLSDLITRNYYGRMAELAHGRGLTVAYETAFGDVIPGDILEYWKWCDTPMCEFWQPYAPWNGGMGHPNFKPVRPCVSAAHIYGKRRIDCEAFTNVDLTWDENFGILKEQAVRHFARGVTHLVFHTCTHNPQTDGRVPGTSFGAYIGTPFVRGQTWWPFMRPFTDWTAACCAFLERGLPVVDVLRYLGDELDHKPDELEFFPDGFKNDYLNADVLLNRLDVEGGRFVLPDGMSYAAIWVPDSVMVLPKTRARLDTLAAKGGRVVYGSADDSVAGLKPQLTSSKPLLWYHRIDGEVDCFFVAADADGFDGNAIFRTQGGERSLVLNLAPFETLLLEFGTDCVRDVAPASRFPVATSVSSVALDNWALSFPAGWGIPKKLFLDRLMPWKDLPGVSEEGRAFSGTATYSTAVNLTEPTNGVLTLDLGVVRDFARVFVNGKEVAALWARPYCCDIAPFVKNGMNEIKIEVTSTWFNRLAYDFSQPPDKRRTWTIWNARGVPCLRQNAAMRDSGMLGPVRLLKPLAPTVNAVQMNGALWSDTTGHVVNAHGGGVFAHDGKYYLYGEHKVYGKAGNRAHVGVHMYSSDDLTAWQDEGIILKVEDSSGHDIEDGCILERPKILFCGKTGRFVMFFHLELKGQGYSSARVGIAVADSPTGPYVFQRSLRPNGGQMSRDMTLYADEDGKAYHFFASEDNATLHIAELTDDYLDYTGRWWRMADKEWTEAPAVCKKGGWYYLIGSGCTGWRPNAARCYRAKTITGPWERMGNPCKGINPTNGCGPELTWGCQSNYILKVSDDKYIAMFDMWRPDNQVDSRLVWLPITFEKDDTISIEWRDCFERKN